MDEYRAIDGSDVYSFLSAFTIFIKRILFFIVGATRKHIILFVCTILIVSIVGVVYWSSSKPIYEGQMTCSFSTLSHKSYGEMVQKLDILARGHSYKSLSASLGLPIELASTIESIEGKNSVGSNLYEDPTGDKSPMYFTVNATDNKVFASLQNALLHYMNTGNPYRAKRDTLEKESLISKIEYLKNDIAATDSIISAYTAYYKHNTGATDSAMAKINITKLLENKKVAQVNIVDAEWRLKEMKQYVELFNGFVIADHPSKNGKKILLTTLVGSLILSLLFVVIAQMLQEIKKDRA